MSDINIEAGGPAWFKSGVQSFQPQRLAVATDDIRLRDGRGSVRAVVIEAHTANGTLHWLALGKNEALELAAALHAEAIALP